MDVAVEPQARVMLPDSPVYPWQRSSTERMKRTIRNLYIAHFLSTWGIRNSEFSCTIFLAAAFPGTLYYVSLYTLAKSLTAVLFSSRVGSIVDQIDRLRAARFMIRTVFSPR